MIDRDTEAALLKEFVRIGPNPLRAMTGQRQTHHVVADDARRYREMFDKHLGQRANDIIDAAVRTSPYPRAVFVAFACISDPTGRFTAPRRETLLAARYALTRMAPRLYPHIRAVRRALLRVAPDEGADLPHPTFDSAPFLAMHLVVGLPGKRLRPVLWPIYARLLDTAAHITTHEGTPSHIGRYAREACRLV